MEYGLKTFAISPNFLRFCPNFYQIFLGL